MQKNTGLKKDRSAVICQMLNYFLLLPYCITGIRDIISYAPSTWNGTESCYPLSFEVGYFFCGYHENTVDKWLLSQRTSWNFVLRYFCGNDKSLWSPDCENMYLQNQNMSNTSEGIGLISEILWRILAFQTFLQLKIFAIHKFGNKPLQSLQN